MKTTIKVKIKALPSTKKNKTKPRNHAPPKKKILIKKNNQKLEMGNKDKIALNMQKKTQQQQNQTKI